MDLIIILKEKNWKEKWKKILKIIKCFKELL